MGVTRGRNGLGRQLVSCVAAYALVLHAILIGFSAGAAAKGGSGDAAFELCLHDSGGADAALAAGAPNAPAKGERHCPFCIAGGSAFVPPKPLFVSCAAQVLVSQSPCPESPDLPPAPEVSVEQPRGPPLA